MSKKRFWLIVCLGAGIGFLIGLTYGFRFNPPFDGILQSSADVQGLTYYSWIVFSIIGTFIGTIVGFVVSTVFYITLGPSDPKELEGQKE